MGRDGGGAAFGRGERETKWEGGRDVEGAGLEPKAQ